MMTMCWLKLYKSEHVMSVRWGVGGEFCRDIVKHIASRLQCLKAKKIQFGLFDLKRIYVGTVDCVHCGANEFWTDPNSKWYSHKLNGAGVLYEVIVDICKDKILWTAGPKPASTHDITFFCVVTQLSTNHQRNDSSKHKTSKNEATLDKNVLCFQVPEGKKLIRNSG
jgi:hypothetical protein